MTLEIGWSVYIVPLFLGAIVSAALAIHTWLRVRREGPSPTLLTFGLLMVAAHEWSLTYGLHFVLGDPGYKHLFLQLANAGTVAVPTLWLLFALSYVGRQEWLTRRTLAVLALEPLVVLVVTATTTQHQLLWAVDWAAPVAGGEPLSRELGPAFRFHAVYSYLLILAGSGVIVAWLRRSAEVFRWQAGLLLGAAFLPLVANVVFLVGYRPDGINFSAATVPVSGLVFAVAISRYRLLDFVPVGRRSVVEEMRDGYVVLDEEDRVVDHNPAASRLLARADDDMVGADGIAALSPFASALDGAPSTSGDGPETVTAEIDGEHRVVDVDVTPLEGTGGRLVLLRDVTARHRIETRFRTLIEASTDMVTVLDAAGRITYQSPAAGRLLGHDPDAMEGDVAFEYVHPEDREHVAETFAEQVAESGSSVVLEYRFRDADGEYRVLESRGRNLLDRPFVDGVVVNSRDVTDARERERELAATNERLERFAAVVSHDLRNPLTIAEGNRDLLAQRYDDDELDDLAAAHDRMERIIDDVLALARDDEAVEDPEPVALEDVVRRSWEAVDTADATLGCRCAVDLRADPDRLARLLENLFRNAVEHGREDVRVSVGTFAAGFSVADDGPGIDEDDYGQLFRDGYTTADEGTGLGLSIVETIARAHGWSVAARPSASGGLRVEVLTDR